MSGAPENASSLSSSDTVKPIPPRAPAARRSPPASRSVFGTRRRCCARAPATAMPMILPTGKATKTPQKAGESSPADTAGIATRAAHSANSGSTIALTHGSMA